MRATYRIWVKNAGRSLPDHLWRGLTIISQDWVGTDVIRLAVESDGSDLERLLRSHKDVFSLYERIAPKGIATRKADLPIDSGRARRLPRKRQP